MSKESLELSKQIGRLLKKKRATLGVAESCTGGFISHMIISVPGSSAYFKGAIVSYDNQVKSGVLGVKSQTLRQYGAVSAACAAELARGTLKTLKCDYAIATTGIAGPTGAVKGKPVGTVYIAFASKSALVVERFSFRGGRLQVIRHAARQALEMLSAGLL